MKWTCFNTQTRGYNNLSNITQHIPSRIKNSIVTLTGVIVGESLMKTRNNIDTIISTNPQLSESPTGHI